MDRYTEVEHVSWGRRIIESLKGVLIGLLLFFGSFAVLWLNEGEAVKDYEAWAAMEDQVHEAALDRVDPANEGKLVRVSGLARTTHRTVDPEFGVASEGLRLRRKVQMYQWHERVEEKREKKWGGGEKRTKDYIYTKGWYSHAIDSSEFRYPRGHRNPDAMPFGAKTTNAETVELGAYTLSKPLVDQIDVFEPLEVTKRPRLNGYRVHEHEGGFYLGERPRSPRVGDLRVTFSQALPQHVTVTAAQSGRTFTRFGLPNGRSVQRLDLGELSSEDVKDTADEETRTRTWYIRGVGFLMMWIGMVLLGKPLSVLADVIPFLGTLIEWFISLASFFVALTLSVLTVALAWFAFRPFLAGSLLGLGFFSFLAGIKWRSTP